MKESTLHRSIREAAYKEFGHVNLSNNTGMLKIFKMATIGQMGEGGWPDMAIFIRGGVTTFFELKVNGNDCTDLQLQRHAELRALGFNVYVVSERSRGMEIIRTEVARAKGIPRSKRVPARFSP